MAHQRGANSSHDPSTKNSAVDDVIDGGKNGRAQDHATAGPRSGIGSAIGRPVAAERDRVVFPPAHGALGGEAGNGGEILQIFRQQLRVVATDSHQPLSGKLRGVTV